MTIRSTLIKLSIVSLFAAGFVFFGLTAREVRAYRSGPDPSLTGAPGEATCTSCHGGGPTGGVLALSGLPAGYGTNQEVTLTVTLTQSARSRYGFQLTAIDDTGKRAGDLIPTDNRTQTQTNSVSNNLRQYINHTDAGSAPFSAGVGGWSFTWKAPAQIVGRVTFYLAGNAANGTGSTSGDSIYTTSVSLYPNLASVSAASYKFDSAAEAIIAAFGEGLAQNTVPAPSQPLPVELDGTQVKVKDPVTGEDRNAPLFFVAARQINYLVPAGTSAGTATVSVRRSGNIVSQGTLLVGTIAPSLFSANASGSGVAAAQVFRRNAAGQDSFEPISQFNSQTNNFQPIPIDLGPDTDLVFLIAYGTGFRFAGPLSAITCTIGSEPAEVIFIGPTPGYTGLDQANIRIPRSLIGRGNVDVVFKANNITANTVTINVK